MVIDRMAALVEGWLTAADAWRRRHPWLNGDIIASTLVLVLSVYFFADSVRLGLSNGQQAAPGTFPALISAGIAICSAIWLIGALLKLRAPDEPDAAPSPAVAQAEDGDNGAGDTVLSESANWRVVFLLAWSALLLPLTETIGMVPMLFVYLLGLFVVIARSAIWKSALVIGVVLLVFAWGAYEGRIYMPDPFRLGRAIHNLLSSLTGGAI